METEEKKTIGQRIGETVETYTKIYKVLKDCGNKTPARVVLSEAWLNEEYITSQVMVKLKELYRIEAEKEGGGGY